MRIIAGIARGRTIAAPPGDSTRPTIDRVRESLMSSVNSAIGDIEGAYVCDAFAGSGALGLEALSRGAAFATFCDTDKKALETVRKNIQTLGFDEATSAPREASQTKVLAHDVLRHGLPLGPKPYNVVFLDPPYATELSAIAEVLKLAKESGKLAEGCLVTYEHDDRVTDEDIEALASNAGLEVLRSKTYGQTTLHYLQA